MKISFVIPAFNEEHYLSKCLESVISEIKNSGCRAEIIVVNNASTDGTRELAEKFSKVIVVDESKKGLSRARQAGLEASTGEIIANIDADTILPEGWINTVFNYFENDSRLVGLSGPPKFYDVSRYFNFWVFVFNCLGYLTYLFNRYIFRISSVMQGGNFVVKKSAMEQIGGFDPQFTFYGEDADIARRLYKVGKITYTFKLPIYMSGRRLVAEGKVKVASRYIVNYFWTIFLGRPFTTTSVDIRTSSISGDSEHNE